MARDDERAIQQYTQAVRTATRSTSTLSRSQVAAAAGIGALSSGAGLLVTALGGARLGLLTFLSAIEEAGEAIGGAGDVIAGFAGTTEDAVRALTNFARSFGASEAAQRGAADFLGELRAQGRPVSESLADRVFAAELQIETRRSEGLTLAEEARARRAARSAIEAEREARGLAQSALRRASGG